MTKPVLPPTYLVVSIVAAVGAHLLFPLAKLIGFPWNMAGVLFLGIGAFLNLAADKAFKMTNTTVKPYEESSTLITSGVFRICRHPMYLGMVLILLGIAVLLGSLAPLIVAVIFALVMEKRFIGVEEEMMETTFGEQYRDYKQRVRKWF